MHDFIADKAMTNEIGEDISALVDGELTAAERDKVLARMAADRTLLTRWGRYHLISDALRRGLPHNPEVNLAPRVQEALAAEPSLVPPAARPRIPPPLMKQLAGMAVAASVAVIAVLGFRVLTEEVDPSPGFTASVPAQGEAYMRISGMRWDSRGPEVDERLIRYLVNHNEHASGAGMHGMMSYGRIAGYDPR
jgi:sigma-E factor negative regulatory protein RseA